MGLELLLELVPEVIPKLVQELVLELVPELVPELGRANMKMILCEIRSKYHIITFKINISFGTVTGLVL